MQRAERDKLPVYYVTCGQTGGKNERTEGDRWGGEGREGRERKEERKKRDGE